MIVRKFAACSMVCLLFASAPAQAEIKVTSECNRDSDATPEFKFKSVPSPASNDAATKARFSIVDGTRDNNSGRQGVLHDGKMPSDANQPRKGFFFAPAQDGGRVVVDLDHAIDIKQINTYSWHVSSRGPQVYKLYASDGAKTELKDQLKKPADPAKVGWKLIASVDTRPASVDSMGGQYGVSVANTSGTIGKYRYLLFDISATESTDPFGNTFYNEIDVVDAAGPVPVAATASAATKLVSTSPASAAHRITIDYSDAPELKDWVEKKLQPTCDAWYPKIIAWLPSDKFTEPKTVDIVITDEYNGVAATGGNHVVCSTAWFKQNYNGEGLGAVVHELVHVVQQYHSRSNPGWLVEGLADYIRWFKYEPKPTGTRPRDPSTASYTNSYRITAGFLNFVVNKHDKDLIKKLNADMRQGKYDEDNWKKYTGKSLDDLWSEYVESLH